MKQRLLTPVLRALVTAGMLTQLAGCLDGGGGTTLSGAQSPTGSTQSASLAVSASFPDAAARALIDDATDAIRVRIYQGQNLGNHYCDFNPFPEMQCPQPVAELTLTRANPNGQATGLVVGPVKVVVTALDDNNTPNNQNDDRILEQVIVPGELGPGNNSLTLPLLRGNWALNTPINLNKTLANSGERIDSVAFLPYTAHDIRWNSGPSTASNCGIWCQSPNHYRVLVRGANLPGDCGWSREGGSYEFVCSRHDQERMFGTVQYLVGFSHQASRNVRMIEWDVDDVPLKPDGDRPRFLTVIPPSVVETLDYYGTGTSDSSYTQSFTHNGQDVTAEINAIPPMSPSDTGTNLVGNLIEIEVISLSETETCYTDANRTQLWGGTGTCPWRQEATSAKAAKASQLPTGAKQAIARGIQARNTRAGKAAPDANGCYSNLQVSWSDEWTSSWYTDTSLNPVYVRVQGSGQFDACLHSLNANGSTLTSAQIDEINQSTGMNVGVAKARR